jgi:hypothetical protein
LIDKRKYRRRHSASRQQPVEVASPVALHVESKGRAAALADEALWAVFDALSACGASPGDGGDAALSLARPCRTVHSLYGMWTCAVHVLSILRRGSIDPRVIRRVNKPAQSRLLASDRAQKAVLSPPCSLPESKDVYSSLEIPKYSGPGPCPPGWHTASSCSATKASTVSHTAPLRLPTCDRTAGSHQEV